MTIYWKISLVIAYTLLVGALSWHIKAVFDDDKAGKLVVKQDAVIIGQQTGILTQERTGAAITNEVSNAYQTKLTRLDTDYAGLLDGLHASPPAGASPVRPAAGAAGGRNAAACPAGLSVSNKRVLVNLARQADIQTQRLVACQAWIKQEFSK